MTERENHEPICGICEEVCVVYVDPCPEDLIEDASEAISFTGLDWTPKALAAFVVEHRNDPAKARKLPKLEIAFHRTLLPWMQRQARVRAASYLGRGLPFVAYELVSRHEDCCALAQKQHGTLYFSADTLPNLPFTGCAARDHCRCMILGKTKSSLVQR